MDVFTDIELKNLVVCLFSVIIFLAFIKLLFRSERMSTFEKKVIGGLTVFVVALVANNSWVYGVSFFIGGLLIATENFLIHLAGIFKADKRDVSDITRDYFDKISPAETEEKIEREAVEVLKESKSLQKPTTEKETKIFDAKVVNTISDIKQIENEVFKILAMYVNRSIKPFVIKEHVRVGGDDYVKDFDAIITHVIGSKSIYAGVEIKYFTEYKLAVLKKYFQKEANAYNAYKTLFVIVFSKFDARSRSELLSFRTQIVSDNVGVGVVFAELTSHGLKIIDDTDLENFFPHINFERREHLRKKYPPMHRLLGRK